MTKKQLSEISSKSRILFQFILKAFSCGEFDLDQALDEKTTTDFEFLFQTLNCHYLVLNESIRNPKSDAAKAEDEAKDSESSQRLSIKLIDSNNLVLSKSCKIEEEEKNLKHN